MSKQDFAPMLYTSNTQVAALNKVPGVDPLKLLRRGRSVKTGEEVLKLDLASKKLWFRLAYPKGRVRLRPLRITEKLAIYEAQVFLSQEDAEPVSSFTSSFQKADVPNGQYIKAAQDDATDNALTDAGFGIQFSDVSTPESERHFGSEYPVSALEGHSLTVNTSTSAEVKKPTVVQQATSTVQAPPESTAKETVMAAPVQQKPEPAKSAEPALAAEEKPGQSKTADPPHPEANQALEILRGGTSQPAAAGAVNDTPAASTVPVATYTSEMPVEEIIKRMSLEQAKAVVVDSGTCRGKTIEEVAARRSASLKFYLSAGYTSNNNIIRAAARIMLDSMNLPKAG